MIAGDHTPDLVFKGVQTVYNDAYAAAPAYADKIAMTVPSQARDETCGWLGQFPQMREWIGSRHFHDLKAHSFSIKNRSFESTIKVKADDISDDRLGIFKPMFGEMGWQARQHPEQMIFELLAAGFDTKCFDGSTYFSETHTVIDAKEKKVDVSNMQDGTGPAWFLLDTSRMMRPIVWQVREGYTFISMASPGNPTVFLNGEHSCGVNARVNAGFGLWQLAYASKAELTPDNYAAARAAMMSFRSDSGRVLGINPTTLVVSPALEKAAMHLVNTEISDGGGSNPWKNTAELIVTPFLTA